MISYFRWCREQRLMKLLAAQVASGVLSADEARARLGLEPWDDGQDNPGGLAPR
jgi:hypothetical protein